MTIPGKKLPLLVFGILSIVGGFLALPLPETRHRPLPETIDDLEHYEEFCRFKILCIICLLIKTRTRRSKFHSSLNSVRKLQVLVHYVFRS